jgi:hypothetical protein
MYEFGVELKFTLNDTWRRQWGADSNLKESTVSLFLLSFYLIYCTIMQYKRLGEISVNAFLETYTLLR